MERRGVRSPSVRGSSGQHIVDALEAYGLQERLRLHVVAVNQAELQVVVDDIGATEEIGEVRRRHRVHQLEGKRTSNASIIGGSSRRWLNGRGKRTWWRLSTGMSDRKAVTLGNLNPMNESSTNV